MDSHSIKSIYGCKPCNKTENLSPLEKWYNSLIEKSSDEIDMTDLLRMLRQGVLLELAIPKVVALLTDNPFVGISYEGELLWHLRYVSSFYLEQYYTKIVKILSIAEEELRELYWLPIEDSDELRELILELRKRVTSPGDSGRGNYENTI